MDMEILLPICGLLFIAVAVYLLLRALKGTRAERWPQVEAVITRSMLKTQYASDSGLSPSKTDYVSGSDVGPRTMYQADIIYEYRVAGTTYKGHRVSTLDTSTNSKALAVKVRDRYPLDARVKAYVDPRDPEFAVLETGVSTSAIFLVAVFALMGMIMLLISM